MDSQERRFAFTAGDAGNTLPYHHGYHADIWLGMLIAGWNHYFYRHHAGAGKWKLDTTKVVPSALTPLPVVSPSQLDGVMSADLANDIPVNVLSRHSLKLGQALHDINLQAATGGPANGALGADVDADAHNKDPEDLVLTNMPKAADILERRLDTRLAYMLRSFNEMAHYSALNVRQGRNHASARIFDKDTVQLPPLDEHTLDLMIRQFESYHAPVETSSVDKASLKALDTMISRGADNLRSFMASQEALAERLAAIISSSKEELTYDEAFDSIQDTIRDSFTRGQLMSSTPPQEVDFTRVLSAFKMDTTVHEASELIVEPRRCPNFRAMHHQLVDAYIVWQREQSLIHSSILANEIGTGKTIITILVIYLDYLDILDRKAQGLPFEARPSLILTPASLVGQTFKELIRHFGGLINLKCLYGLATDFKGSRAAATVTRAEFFNQVDFAMAPGRVSSDPEVRRRS